MQSTVLTDANDPLAAVAADVATLAASLATLSAVLPRILAAISAVAGEHENADAFPVLTRKQAQARLGISERTLIRWLQDGRLDEVQLGGRRYVTVESINRHPRLLKAQQTERS